MESSTTFKDFIFVAFLAIFVAAIPTQCDEHLGRSNFTQGSSISVPLSLERSKPLSIGQQKSPAVVPGQRKSTFPTLPLSKESNDEQADDDKLSGNPATLHDSSIIKAQEAERLSVANKSIENRSNSSSSRESGVILASFIDHHDEESSGRDSSSADAHSDDDDNHAVETSRYEHVEKYQLHQSSEEDDDIPASPALSPKRPVQTNNNNASVTQDDKKSQQYRGSVVISSESLPVRVPPSPKDIVNQEATIANNGNGRIQKPIPVVRHEESILYDSFEDDGVKRLK